MSRCSYHQRSASDYSSLFNSGLRAISESHGRRRSMSAPPSVESLTLSSILPIRSNFYSVESSTSIQDDAASQRDAGSEPNSRTPGFRNVWKIKGVPLQLGLSRTLSDDSDLSPSRFVSLDPLAPSPVPAAMPYFIDLSDRKSDDSDSSPTSINYRDDSFLSPHSVSQSEREPLRSRGTQRKRPISISIQTKRDTFRCSSFSPVDQMLDLQPPVDIDQTRLDTLPQSAIDAEFSHLEFYGAEGHQGDWRQFHADWISDQQEVTFNPMPCSPCG